MDNCQTLLSTLQMQLSDAFRVSSIGGICVIDTPFRYPDNRSLRVYAQSAEDGSFELSDDGYAHMFVRVAGVSRAVIKGVSAEISDRLGVDANSGEVLAKVATPADLLSGMIALVEGSQRVADSISRKRLGESTARLDRQIASTLVAHNRVYRKRDTIPVGDIPIDVDYNVLPDDEYKQLNLFSVTTKTSQRVAESIAYRVDKIQSTSPSPGYTDRVFAVIDDAMMFSDSDRWRKVKDTIARSNVQIIPITNTRELSAILAS